MIIKSEHNFQKKVFYHCDAHDLNVQKLSDQWKLDC